MMAAARCAPVSEWMNSYPRASSSASGASVPYEAGTLPSMHGVGERYRPPVTVKFSDTWCPASCQPHGAAPPGVPKIRKQYRSGSNRCAIAGASSSMSARRTCSIAMMETTFAYPGMLTDAAISRCASLRCGSVSDPIASPPRSGSGRYDHSRRAPESSKSLARTYRCDSSSAPLNAAAAAAIRAAVSGARYFSIGPPRVVVTARACIT